MADAKYKVRVGDAEYEVTAPNEDVAWQWANRAHAQAQAETKAAPPIPRAAPTPAPMAASNVGTAEGRLAARQPLRPVEAPSIFDYFTDRQAAIKQSRARAEYIGEVVQRDALEDIKTQTGFLDRLGDMFSKGLLSTRANIKDTQRAIEADPELKQQFTREARRFAADKGVEVKGTTSLEDVKENFLRNAIPFALEQISGMLPGTIAAATPLPGLGASNVFGGFARDVTDLEGRQDVELSDIARVAPAALAVTALDQIGLGGIFAAPAKTALGRIGKASLIEGGTETIQTAIEYAYPRLITGSDIDPNELFEQVAVGAVLGGTMGGGLRGIGEIATAPFRSKGEGEPGTEDPGALNEKLDQEVERLVTAQTQALMDADPNLTQRQAYNQVVKSDSMNKLFDTAYANILLGSQEDTDADTGVDVTGGGGAGTDTDIGPPPPGASAAESGETVGGGLERAVSGVPVPNVGEGPRVASLDEAKQILADKKVKLAERVNVARQILNDAIIGNKIVNDVDQKQYDAAKTQLANGKHGGDPMVALEAVTGKKFSVPVATDKTATAPTELPKIAHSLEPGDVVRTDMGDTFTISSNTPLGKRGDRVLVGTWDNGKEAVVRASEFDTGFIPQPYTDANTGERKMGEAWTVEKAAPPAPDVATQETVQQTAPDVATQETVQQTAPEGEPVSKGPDLSQYTPQQIAENITMFSSDEARRRGYEDDTDAQRMFVEGVRDTSIGLDPLPDDTLLQIGGQKVLTAYKDARQWAQETIAAAQVAPEGEPEVAPVETAPEVAPEVAPEGEPEVAPSPPKVARDFRAAIKMDDGAIYAGEPGETHFSVYEANPQLDYDKMAPEGDGFVDSSGKFYTRKEASAAIGRTGIYDELYVEDFDIDGEAAPDEGVVFDLTDAPRNTDIMATAEELPEAERVNVRARLDRIMANYAKDNDTERLLGSLEALRQDVNRRIERDRAKRDRDRVRGFERAMEVIYRAERTGQLTPEGADLIRWLLKQNPAIADELAISIREGGAQDTAGQYNPATRVATIFASRANEGTAAHEVLHHAERLMPEKVREGIRAAWMKRIQDLIALANKTGNRDMREVLGTIVSAYYGDPQAQQELRESFGNGSIPYSLYHLSNPSEFWAVNATDLIGKRAKQTGWLGAARTWLSDFIEKAKNLFGLTNNSSVIAGIKAIMAVESGTIQGKMLSASTRDFRVYAGRAARAVNRSKLDEAKALEAAGALPGPTGTTRAKTGWFRGVDGEWRFEISDLDMKFKEGYTPDRLKGGRTYLLGQIIDHPELFANYPDLQKINVVVNNAAGDAGGHWDAGRNEIVISNRTPKEVGFYLDTLIHELQHAVQTWEGFASGAHFLDYPVSLDAINKALSFLAKNNGQPLFMWGRYYKADELRDIRNWLEYTRDENGDQLQQDNDFLRSFAARRTEIATERQNRTRSAEDAWRNGDHPEAVKLIELRDARIAAATRMQAPSFSSEEQAALRNEYEAASAAESAQAKYVIGLINTGVVPLPDMRDLDAADEYLYDKRDEVFARRDKVNEQLARVGADKLFYYLTAGEVEARDVEQRREKIDEEREATPPYVGERFGSPSDMITVNPYTRTSASPPKVVSGGKVVTLTEAQKRTVRAKVKAKREKMNRIQKRIARTNDAVDVMSGQIELGKLVRGDEANWALLRGVIDTIDVGKWQLILPTLSTEDIFRILKGRIPGLVDSDRIIRRDIPLLQSREYTKLAEELEEIAEFLKKYPKAAQALSDLEFATVAYQVDPTKAVTPEEYFAKVDGKAKEIRAKIKTEKDPKKKGSLEQQLSRRFGEIESVYKGVPGDERVLGWRDLGRPEFGGNKGKEIFKLIRDAHRRDLEAKYNALRARLMETKKDEALAEALKKLEARFKPIREQVIYFPAMRFGSYYARVGTGANSIFKMFETPTKRNQFVQAMKARAKGAANPDDYEVTETGNVEDLRDNFEQVTGGPFKEVLDLFEDNPKDIGALKGQVFDLMLQTLTAGDMRKHMAPRKMRAGYSTDILKNFANFRRSTINDLKRAQYGYKLRTEISRAQDQIKELPDREKLSVFAKEIELRTMSALMPPDRTNKAWEQAIQFGNKMAFYQYLANPKTAIIQLTQMHIVSLPMLAQKYGHVNAAAALTKYGFSGLGGFLVGQVKATPRPGNGWSIDWEQPNLLDNPISALKEESDPELYEVLADGWNAGRDINLFMDTFANDLGGFATADPDQTTILQDLMDKRPLTATMRGAIFTFEAMGALMHQMERVNREATYMAALELAYRENKKKGQNHDEAKKNAIEDATNVTLEATFDFSSYNKPRILTTPVGRVAGQFYSFPYMMSSLIIRKMFTMLKVAKLEPGERVAATEIAVGTMLNMFAYAGITGLPIYGLAMGVATSLLWLASQFDDEEEEGGLSYVDENGNIKKTYNVEWWFRNVWIPKFFGPDGTTANLLGLEDDTAATLALSVEKGPISAITDVDLSNSVALDFFFFLPQEPRADTAEGQITEYTFNILTGAAGGTLMDYVKGGKDLMNGYTNRALEKLPKLYGNVAKANRYAEEGQLNYKDELVGMNAAFWTDDKVALQAFGLASTEASQRQQQNYEGRTITKKVGEAREALLEKLRRVALDSYKYGYTPEVAARRKEVLEEWTKFNKTYPTDVIGIDTIYTVQTNAVMDALKSRAARGVPMDDKGKTPYLQDILRQRMKEEEQ
jgi:hypothetical protein